MAFSDWISILALCIASGALALEVRRWFESKPRLALSVMADALVVPSTDETPKLALYVINRGHSPTHITHMVLFMFKSWLHRLRGRSYYAAIVKVPHFPAALGINGTTSCLALYTDELREARSKGHLYAGVVASHRNKPYLARVAKREQSTMQENTIEAG